MTNFLITKPPQEPKLEDFGLSEEIIEKYRSYKEQKSLKDSYFSLSLCIFSFICSFLWIAYEFISHGFVNNFSSFLSFILASIIGTHVIGMILAMILALLIKIPILVLQELMPTLKDKEFKIFEEKHEKYKKAYESYEYDKKRYEEYLQSKKREYWFNLSGHEFEYKLANLYKTIGYKADVTKGSGDAGIDIILEKDGEKYCVQCKAHKKPVGPAIVRELYGAMHSAGIRQGILVCLGGFTSGVYDFVKDKPIKLVDIDDVIKMVNE